MTVSSTNSRLSYNGDGVSVNFATPYFLANADIKVYVGGVLKTLTTDYTLTGAGTESGGTCSFLSAPASGTGNVVILRDPDQLQSTDLPSNDPFPSSSVEKAFDKLTMLVQRCRDLLGRSFTLQDSDTSGASVTMPTPTAGKLLAWASDGLSIVNSAPTGVVAGSITATELASDAVEEEAILNGAVTTNKLGALAVTAAKLAADAVETAKIKDANVTNGKLSANAVTLAKTDASGLQPIVVLRDEKASGTSGGTFNSGAWQTRDLNTKATDTHSICTLAANQFSLPAGTYEINVRAPCFLTGQTKAKLRNVSDGSDTIIGASGYAYGAAGGDAISSTVDGVFTIASSKTFEVQHRCATTSAVSGFGYADGFSVVEVYTEVFIRKIA